MNTDDPPDGAARENPRPLEYRAPRDDGAPPGDPPSQFGCAYAIYGTCVGSLALPMAAYIGTSGRSRIDVFVAIVAVVLFAICCASWKPMRAFGIGLLIGMGIFVLLVGACFVAFSGRL
jgi:hypothetical protein